jgi:photosystem II stability/assembly factor-like uncharacterized protein
MQYRNIGPTRGGRVVAVAGDPVNKAVFYFGSTGGGVWKSEDAGTTWRNVSDGYFQWASVGALAVAPSDPNVIYAGMGETTIRGNVSRGDGVYKSTDAGRTWTHLGLAATQNIGCIVIHPRNPDHLYVAAFGHVWGPNEERGIYRSQDGGQTWQQVLHVSDRAGALDISMDPTNPRILFASTWEAYRTPYSLNSGGPGSGLYRSTDAGDSWERLNGKPGMPEGILGKIGVGVAAGGGRVYGIIEAEKGGLYRSEDNGETWALKDDDPTIIQRPWYWMHCIADPQDPNTLWLPSYDLLRSIDGGNSFQPIATTHADNHGLWIDPEDSNRMILGNDGGACVTFNGGLTWSSIYNQPTAELYHVTTDTRRPYRVYGAQQDNTTISVPSQSSGSAIDFTGYEVIGGGESGYIAVRPDNPDIIFAGSYQGLLTRYDHGTGQVRNITVWPENWSGHAAAEWKYRFQWTAPTVLSPHDPDILYTGGNMVFRSTDEGHSWQAISDDLTRADPETLGPTGGPISKDMTGAEVYATVFAIAESPVEQGTIWSGSDDGLIYLSRDGGESWQNVTMGPDLLPEWGLISIIDPSPHNAATCYVAATRYKSHDDAPYLFKTTDYGQSWQLITNGIPDNEFTRAIREDPEAPGLLYAGTERGVWYSLTGGASWESLKLNLPVVPIHDLVVKDGDLVVATHGRSFWILDDLGPLRQLASGAAPAGGTTLFKPRDTVRWLRYGGFGHAPIEGRNYRMTNGLLAIFDRSADENGQYTETYVDAGNNPPDGVLIHYRLDGEPAEREIAITIGDADGNEISRFSNKAEEDKRKLYPKSGANRFVWNFRYPDASEIEGDEVAKGFINGPKAPPGRYTVTLTIDSASQSHSFEILPDPRLNASADDLRAQFDLQLKIRDKISAIHEAVASIRRMRAQIDTWIDRADSDPVKQSGESLKAKLDDIESNLIQVKAKSAKDRLKFPVKLNSKLSGLMSAVASAEGRPNEQSHAVFAGLSARADEHLARFEAVKSDELVAFNRAVEESSVAAVG